MLTRRKAQQMQPTDTEDTAFDTVGISVSTSSATGASTKELMARMGHASPRAALIYQHASHERDAAIAQALSDTIAKATPTPSAEVVSLPQTTEAN